MLPPKPLGEHLNLLYLASAAPAVLGACAALVSASLCIFETHLSPSFS